MEVTKNLKSFDDFKKLVAELYEKTSSDNTGFKSELLFRGHSDSNWELATTLDRIREKPFGIKKYFQLVLSIKPEIETFTKQNWDVGFEEVKKYAKNFDGIFFNRVPGYEYLVYLRHHGFPSPLLDWSASPYVAAFFAYCNESDNNDVAIYCYQEFVENHKHTSDAEPQIVCPGPNVRSHKRHFLQQSRYTFCVAREKSRGTPEEEYWEFHPHEEVFNLGEEGQDKLTKYILPASERGKVLAYLDMHNINAFSLFQDEAALLETLSLRKFVLSTN